MLSTWGMPPPQKESPRTRQIPLRVPPELCDEIEEARGHESREAWIRRLIREELERLRES